MERLIVAEVLKPQGIRGELKVKTFTDYPEDLKTFKQLFIDGTAYKILSFRVGEGDVAYIGLRGVPDRNAAELLRGKKLEGDREDAPELEDGQYYIVDLIGLTVVKDSGEIVGTVKDITSLSTDVYTLDHAGKDVLFPAVKNLILEVDLTEKRIVVDGKRFDEVVVR